MVLYIADYLNLDVNIALARPIKVYPDHGGVGDEYLCNHYQEQVRDMASTGGVDILAR